MLEIDEQPEQNRRFRTVEDYRKDSHGALKSVYAVRQSKRYPKVVVRPPSNDSGCTYYILVALYSTNSNSHCISPHLLLSMGKARKTLPINYAPIFEELVKSEHEACYIFNLKNVGIFTQQEKRRENLELKYAAMREYQPNIRAIYEPMENENAYVYLGFSVYRKNATGQVHCIVQPTFSNAIYNVDNLPVPQVINSTGSRFGGTQVCLIILKARKSDWQIFIYLPNRDARPIEHCEVNPAAISIKCCTITFTMPSCVPRVSLEPPPTKALIQVRRSDGAISRFLDFNFDDNRKRHANWPIDSLTEKRTGPEEAKPDEYLPRLNVNSDCTVACVPVICTAEGRPKDSTLGQDPREIFLTALQDFYYMIGQSTCAESTILELNKAYADKHPDGNTIFHDAIRYSSNGDFFTKLYKLKHARTCISRFQNDMRRTLLHYACELDRSTLIRQLVGLECPLDAQDFAGNTPLHLALLKGHHKCTEVFTAIFESPSDYEHMGEQIKQLLMTYNNIGLTALHLAVMHDEQDLVRSLLQFCKEQKFEASSIQLLGNGDTLLHLAVASKLEDMVAMILEYEPCAREYENYAGRTAAGQVTLDDDMQNLQLC